MKPHPSSISSSDARRYVLALALGSLALLGLLATVSAVSYRFGLIDVATRWVYDYQLEKIDSADEISVVFVGDSSLGSAIDAEMFSDIYGKPTVSLALSGTYGLGASFNMIRRAKERHDVTVAVVMQALNTMTRPDTVAGYFFTTSHLEWRELSPIELIQLFLNYRTAKETIQQVARRGFKRERPKMSHDYVAQNHVDWGPGELDEKVSDDPLLPGMVSQSEIDFVARIVNYCDAEGILCVYAHGPIYDGYCDAGAAYIESLNEAITNVGLTVAAGTPICMPAKQVGNALDHVIPSEKRTYTRAYYERLAHYIAEAKASPVALNPLERDRRSTP